MDPFDPRNPRYVGRPVNFPSTGLPSPVGPGSPGGNYDPNVTYRNPTYATPGPLATQNRGYWSDQPKTLRWLPPTAANAPLNSAIYGPTGAPVTSRALWATPVFDLRPDLGASNGAEYTRAYPIFRGGSYGAGIRIECQVFPPAGVAGVQLITSGASLGVYSVELGHAADPSQVTFSGSRQNITNDFFDGVNSSTLVWAAPDAAAVRYWQVQIMFEWLGTSGDEPGYICLGAAQ